MEIRLAASTDADAWIALRAALWPDEDATRLHDDVRGFFIGAVPVTTFAAVFLAEAGDGAIIGMLELSLRPYADGCEASPVPYVEGWYVAEGQRGRGIGGALMRAAEEWALAHGHTEIASDALIDNLVSERAHKALGFDEVERVIQFRKDLKR